MKKVLAVILAAMLILAVAGCSSEQEKTSENTENKTEVSVQNSSSEESKESEKQEEKETPEEENEESETTIDYTTEMSQWTYQPETENQNVTLFIEIDRSEYGTAGASLKQTSAAVNLLKLTQAEDVDLALQEYLDGMDDTQRDYFSFQWQMTVKTAENLLAAPEEHAAELEESGHGDVDLSAFDTEKLKELDEMVISLLGDYGVEDGWQSHTDIEPFNFWSEA